MRVKAQELFQKGLNDQDIKKLEESLKNVGFQTPEIEKVTKPLKDTLKMQQVQQQSQQPTQMQQSTQPTQPSKPGQIQVQQAKTADFEDEHGIESFEGEEFEDLTLGEPLEESLEEEVEEEEEEGESEEDPEEDDLDTTMKLLGEDLGINWDEVDFDVEQFSKGVEVESNEHGSKSKLTDIGADDLEIAGKIALAHLNEFSDYYDRLEKMESN